MPLINGSPRLEKKIDEIVFRHKVKTSLRHLGKKLSRYAAVMLLVLIAGSMIIFSVEASRNYITNLMIEWKSDHAKVEFVDSGDETDHLAGFLPEGFIKTEDEKYFRTYRNEKSEKIYIEWMPIDSSGSFNNENVEFNETDILGNTVCFFESEKEGTENIVFFAKDNLIITITSELNTSILLGIAENILSAQGPLF